MLKTNLLNNSGFEQSIVPNLTPDTTYTFSAVFKIIDSPQIGGGTIDISLTGQTTKKFNIQHMVHNHYASDFDWTFPNIYPKYSQLKINMS
ncbi:hypothetical protein [Bacillus cereus]